MRLDWLDTIRAHCRRVAARQSMPSIRSRSRRRGRGRRRGHCRGPSVAVVELLEDRTLLSGTSLEVPLDASLDQFGFQPVTVQAFDDPTTPEVEQWVAFSIFDTGASVVSLGATDNLFFSDDPLSGVGGVPVKVVGGAVAEGIGGVLTGDVSVPLTITVDGLGAATLSFDDDGFPVFQFELTDSAATMPGVQVFVGTFDGSESLPTIGGTPMLNPTAEHPGGRAVHVEPEGEVLDFSSIFDGLVLPVPGVSFVESGTDLAASEQVIATATVSDPAGTASSTQFSAAGLLDIDNVYVGFTLRFTSGALAGQSAEVTGYDFDVNTGVGTFALDPAFSAAPASGDTFEIVRFSTEPVEIALDFVGSDNHADPGDQITASPNPVQNGVSIRQGTASLTDQTFLFDTGAMLSTITTEQALALGLDLNNPEDVAAVGGAGGTVSNIPGYVIDELTVPTTDGGTLTFTDVWVYVVDVSTEIDGILGMNLFNSAAAFQYDPFADPDPNDGRTQATLQVTFFEDRTTQPLPSSPEVDALLQLLPFAGAIGVTTPRFPQFTPQLETNAAPAIAAQTFSIDENSASGASVGTVAASDLDNDPLTYSITGGTGATAFAIDSTTGAITVADPAQLDYELTTGFTLTVQVGDGSETASATITVNLNDVEANLAVAATEADKAEGQSGTTALSFRVTRSGDTSGPASANWAVSGDVNAADFGGTLPSGIVSFADGATEQPVTLLVTGDATVELDESLTLTLANPSAGAAITTAAAQGAVRNDDAATLTIGSPTVDEDTGQLTFTVTLTGDVETGFSVDAATADIVGGAVAGTDYAAKSETLTFQGIDGETQSLAVALTADSIVELDEQLAAALANVQAGGRSVTIATAQGTGTIGNDDAATISINSPTVDENAGTMTFTVSLDQMADVDVSIDFATALGSAGADDFTANSGPLTIPAGQTSKTFTVDILAEDLVENDESFTVNLSNVQAAGRDVTIGTAQGTGTIGNDDAALVTIDSPTVDENAGTVTFTVSLDQLVDVDVAVDFATAFGSAQADDFTPTSGTVIIPAGQSSATFTVDITTDDLEEDDESFTVDLSNVQAGGRDVTIGTAQGTGTIVDHDLAHGPNFNGDGRADVIGPAGPGNWVLGVSTGAGFDLRSLPQWSASYWATRVTGDFDGDGSTDIAGQTTWGDWYVGLASSDFGTALWSEWFGVSAYYTNAQVGDFNGDGRDDIVALATWGTWYVNLSNGSGGFDLEAWGRWFGVSAYYTNVRVGDFNGDGNDDIAALATWGTWYVNLSNGTDSFAADVWADWFGVSAYYTNVRVGDFNGDGNDDIAALAVWGTWYVNLSNGVDGFTTEAWGTIAGGPQNYGHVRVGDFDGDGDDDLLVQAVWGTWYVNRSDGLGGSGGSGGFGLEQWNRDFGGPANYPVVTVGDFNGDGRDDFAARAFWGTWFVGLSDEDGRFITRAWG